MGRLVEHQCQRLLEYMDRRVASNTNFGAVVQTFSTVISAWSKKEMAIEQKGLLRHMIDLHKQEYWNRPPNIISFERSRNAWAVPLGTPGTC
jgi:hypothetical protein